MKYTSVIYFYIH